MVRTVNLTKRYRNKEALSGLTLDVPAGSAFALVGPNGAGKSTLFKILMNLIRPTAGTAEMLGIDCTRLAPEQIAQIGYVSENQKLPEWMRVEYFLRYCRAFYPTWDDGLAADLMRRYDLPRDRRLSALSRGMKLKLSLVVSLAYRPRLIILDEPFSGLDILVREQVIESIVEFTPESTVLIASHDLTEIESFATHVAYLNEGRLEFVEEVETLAQRFREIEITLETPLNLPSGLPTTWLNPEQSGVVVRFTDTHYDHGRSREELLRRFSGIRDVQSRQMSFRSIFLALARSRRMQCA